jgi:hypothetical protein
MALTREQTVRLAVGQAGVAESPPGTNRVLYSAWYGLVGPWCAMFISWVVAQAGVGWYRFASTAASVARAQRDGRLIPLDQVLPGDVLVRLYTSTTGHTGMATERPGQSGAGTQVTVEGNTSGGNDRDGGSVQVRRRSTGWWHYAIRLDYPDTPAPQPPAPPLADSVRARTAELQRLLGVTADGQWGPITEGAANRQAFGWSDQVRARGYTGSLPLAGNRNLALVRWYQAQANRRFGAGLVLDGQVGPATNHVIVVLDQQADAIAGPAAMRRATL